MSETSRLLNHIGLGEKIVFVEDLNLDVLAEMIDPPAYPAYYGVENINDQSKLELIAEHFDKYSYEELKKRLE